MAGVSAGGRETGSRHPSRILVVDDDQGIRRLLRDSLEGEGHAVLEAENGITALSLLRQESPDVVLLDLELPGMPGRAILDRIRSDPATGRIPVLVVSGVDSIAEAEACFLSGAEDFVSKPFHWPLLRARIERCLERRAHERLEEEYRRTVERFNVELDGAVRERTRELEEANRRLVDLDGAREEFLTLIGHELRTPVTGLSASGEMLASPDLAPEEREELAGIHRDAVSRLARLVEDALLLARLRTGAGTHAAGDHLLGPILERASAAVAPFALSRGVALDPVTAGGVRVRCDPELLRSALSSLLELLVKLCPPGGCVGGAASSFPGEARIRLASTGGEVPPAVGARLFGVFSVVESLTPGGDLGLGPPLAARILDLLGGGVSLEPAAGPGVVLAVTLRSPDRGAGVAPPGEEG